MAMLAWLACCGPAIAQVEFSTFLTPDGMTAPFESWSRGGPGSSFAAWELFDDEFGLNPHSVRAASGLPASPILPDARQATVEELTKTAFITSGGNLYSFSSPTAFEVVFPGQGLGAGFETTFVAQLGTLGRRADPSSYQLSYEGPSGSVVSVSPTISQLRLLDLTGTFGGELEETLLVWELSGFNPDAYSFTFASAGSSMSLDYLTIDVFAQAAGLAGDYSGDGSIGAEDWSTWRAEYGTAGPSADGNGDGVVDAADYTVWRDASAAPSEAVAVPEPGALTQIAIVAATLSFCFGVVRFTNSRGPR